MSATQVQADSSLTSGALAWHTVTAEEACRELAVDPAVGRTPDKVERRPAQYGANELAEAKKEPGWHAFLRQYPPRDASARIVSNGLAARLTLASFLMAGLALAIVVWGEARYDLVIATTMGLTTLSLMHVVTALEARELKGMVFARYTIENGRFLQMIGAAVLLSFLVTALGPLQRIFGTEALTSRQWGICLLGPIVLLLLLELGKLIDRRFG
jgi:magnesium-transporting ATPase (P-type)